MVKTLYSQPVQGAQVRSLVGDGMPPAFNNNKETQLYFLHTYRHIHSFNKSS